MSIIIQCKMSLVRLSALRGKHHDASQVQLWFSYMRSRITHWRFAVVVLASINEVTLRRANWDGWPVRGSTPGAGNLSQ